MRALVSRIALGLLISATGVAHSGITTPKFAYTDHTLSNGLRVLVAEDHYAPVVSVAIVYNAGSRDERKGRTGFAHLFEHMMFKGSANVADGEHSRLIQNNGGRMNATTDQDRTLYYDTLPANQLDLVLFLEADRMRSLDISRENLDNQRNAVQEERRLRLDNQPYGRTFEVLQNLAYENSYKHLPIGSMEDLNAASVEDVAQFFKTYYAPNNAVMAIVGDVDTKACLARVRKYFESIPSQARPPSVDMSEPPQTAERRQTVEDPLARLTRLDVAYKIPDANSPDLEPLQVLSLALGGGRSSRLYQSLVRDKQVAAQTGTAVGENRGPGLFQVFIAVTPGKAVSDVEDGVERAARGGQDGRARGLGARQGEKRRAPGLHQLDGQLVRPRGSARRVHRLPRQAGQDLHAARRDRRGDRGRRPARRAAVPPRRKQDRRRHGPQGCAEV